MGIELGNSKELRKVLLDFERNGKGEQAEEMPEEKGADVKAPEPKTITASISDILAAQNVIMVSRNNPQPVPNGRYIVPNGQVVVHDNEKGNIGFQFIGNGTFTLKELNKLIQKGLLPVENDEPNAQGINGEIDEPVSQGATGDCWILTGILSLTATKEGKALIKSSMEVQNNGDVIVNFKGLGYSIKVTAEEIRKHDTDDIKNDAFSNGDNDMLVFELAVQKLFEQHPDLKTAYGYDESFKGDDRYITQGGFGNDLVEWLSGNSAQDTSALDKLGDPYEKAGVAEWVTVPNSVTRYAGEEYPRPSSISYDAMFNSNKTNFSNEYINWYNNTYIPIIREANAEAPSLLVNGLSEEEVLTQLQEAYENQPCAITFGMYVFANETVKTAKCVDGTTFTWKYYSSKTEKGELCGHAFAVVGMTQDTITFVNPWDSTQEITMTWDEFAKLGVGRIAYNKLDSVDNGENKPDIEAPDIDDTPAASEFSSMGELHQFIHGSEAVAYVEKALNIKIENSKMSEFMNLATDVANKHQNDLATVTKAQILEELKVAYEELLKVKGSNDKPAEKAAEFADYNALRNYLFSNELRGIIHGEKGITDFSHGFSYEHIADSIAKKHKEDFANVTKEQLIEEFVNEYNMRIADNIDEPDIEGPSNDDTPAASDFSNFKEIVDYIESDELKNYIKQAMAEDFDEKVFEVVIAIFSNKYKAFATFTTLMDSLPDISKCSKAQIREEILLVVQQNTRLNNVDTQMFLSIDELAEYAVGKECYRAVLGSKEMTGNAWIRLAKYVIYNHQSDYTKVSSQDIIKEMQQALNDKSNAVVHGTTLDDLKNKYGLRDSEIEKYFNRGIEDGRYYLKPGIYRSYAKVTGTSIKDLTRVQEQISTIADLIKSKISKDREFQSHMYNPDNWLPGDYSELKYGSGRNILTALENGYHAKAMEKYIPESIINAYFQKNEHGRYDLKDGCKNFQMLDYNQDTKIATYSIEVTKNDGKVVTIEFEVDVTTGQLKSRRAK